MKTTIIREGTVDGHAVKLRTHPEQEDKWLVTKRGKVIGLVSVFPTRRYHLDLYYSRNGYTLVEDFDSLDETWEKIKGYISYFNL